MQAEKEGRRRFKKCLCARFMRVCVLRFFFVYSSALEMKLYAEIEWIGKELR